MRSLVGRLTAIALAIVLSAMLPCPAVAWGDEGHEVIGLIAQNHLDPTVQKKLRALLAADPDDLTAHDIAAASTWPDKLRSLNDDSARKQTRQWHFVDIEIATPDLNHACFGHPPCRLARWLRTALHTPVSSTRSSSLPLNSPARRLVPRSRSWR